MIKLKLQIRKALTKAYGIEKYRNESFLKYLKSDKLQFVILQEMINDNRHNIELMDIVLDKMAADEFKLGMDARDFFISCANQIFFKNLNIYPSRPDEEPSARMKRLHPLWGKSYMSE